MRAQKTETELRKEQIIEAALGLISTEGVSGLSIVGIAGQVGIVPSALYRHFKGKDEVLDGVVEFIKRRLLINVTEVRSEVSAAPQRLRYILMRHARLLAENRAIPHVVFSDGFYTGNPRRKARVGEIIMAYLDKIEEIIEEGRQEGTIRKDIVPGTTSLLFLGMIMPAAVLGKVCGEGFDMIAHAENSWPLFERCIAVDAQTAMDPEIGEDHE
ncbi:TetR/AcrR family transcriptional regulator [Desulfopila inferna]|uniref:TetR/AcrR family transcriptional regulator n=1 Tax=Desulfopila inferna TaxID=468528 RepID=UPI0019654AE7|nr:TetR/AcrR family transcriptional regulator [Desulfopila inferna]MBM9604187.1 TetR/AcrR family transcriptional regulator [Desulfopila inferna]